MEINKNINVGDICETIRGERFVIKDRYTYKIKSSNNSVSKATVEFLETGYTTEAQIGAIRRGSVRDSSKIEVLVVGDIYESNNHGKFTITEVKNRLKVSIKFLDTGYCNVVESYQVRKRQVKDKLKPSVYGVGFVGEGTIKDKRLYSVWMKMLHRCYDKSANNYCSYGAKGVTVCTSWHEYLTFEKWALEQEYQDGWEIDKDIFNIGVPTYCPEHCVFIPKEINNLFKTKPNSTGLPVGVIYTKGKKSPYAAQGFHTNGKHKMVYCGTVEEAKEAYSLMKTKSVRFKVKSYYDKGCLPQRVYDKLKNYTYVHED